MPPPNGGGTGRPQPLSVATASLTLTHTETATPTSSVTSSEHASASPNTSPNLIPLVLAPILAVIGIAGLFILWHYFYKRRKRKRVAPSAEFKKYRRRSVPLADAEGGGAIEAGDRAAG